jgi:hypothetical protein
VAAASRILPATARAHGTGAAGGRGARCKIWGSGGEGDMASRDPRVGKENKETAGADCVLGMKIFLLHSQ